MQVQMQVPKKAAYYGRNLTSIRSMLRRFVTGQRLTAIATISDGQTSCQYTTTQTTTRLDRRQDTFRSNDRPLTQRQFLTKMLQSVKTQPNLRTRHQCWNVRPAHMAKIQAEPAKCVMTSCQTVLSAALSYRLARQQSARSISKDLQRRSEQKWKVNADKCETCLTPSAHDDDTHWLNAE